MVIHRLTDAHIATRHSVLIFRSISCEEVSNQKGDDLHLQPDEPAHVTAVIGRLTPDEIIS